MPLRRTERSDGRSRPRWKVGSHSCVENTAADQSLSAVTATSVDPEAEGPAVLFPSPRKSYGSQSFSTRGRLASAEADARMEESGANGAVRLAILPYGKRHKGYLEMAPGLGGIPSARLVPVVVTPHRFRTKRGFCSTCGLGIVMRSSSDRVRTADGVGSGLPFNRRGALPAALSALAADGFMNSPG
jgi:hypothetical protein